MDVPFAAELGGDVDLVLASPGGLGEQPFGASVAVHVGGVEKVHACVDGPRQPVQGRPLIDVAPRSSDRPGAEADRAHLEPGVAEHAVFHDGPHPFAGLWSCFGRVLVLLWPVCYFYGLLSVGAVLRSADGTSAYRWHGPTSLYDTKRARRILDYPMSTHKEPLVGLFVKIASK